MEQSQFRNFDFDALSVLGEKELRSRAESELKAIYFGLKQYLVTAEEKHASLIAELAAVEKLQEDLVAQLTKVEAVFKPALSQLQLKKAMDARSLAGGRLARKDGGPD